MLCNLKCVRKKYDRFMGGQRGDRQMDGYRIKYYLKKKKFIDSPVGPVIKTLGVSSRPRWGAKISHASQPKKPKSKTEAIL